MWYHTCPSLRTAMPSSSILFRLFLVAFLLVQALLVWRFHLEEFQLSSTHFHRQIMSPHTMSTAHTTHFLQQQQLSRIPKHRASIVQAHVWQTARKYAQSFTTLGRGPLNFFHIPKTAGTAVEEAAANQAIPWSSCRFLHKPKRNSCPYPQGSEWPRNVGWWHLPVHVFPLAGSNPYQTTNLFAIVRSPYERMISEFYYICTLKIKDWRPDQCDNRTRLYDEEYMNRWLQRKLKNRESKSATGLLADNSHFTPQTEFLVGPYQVRVVDHVLRMDDPHESLAVQFARLIKAYGMPHNMTLPFKASIGAVAGAGERNSTQHLGVQNLQTLTRASIDAHYQADFGLLGYAKFQNGYK